MVQDYEETHKWLDLAASLGGGGGSGGAGRTGREDDAATGGDDILSTCDATILATGDRTRSDRFPDCFVIPGNPSTE